MRLHMILNVYTFFTTAKGPIICELNLAHLNFFKQEHFSPIREGLAEEMHVYPEYLL